MQESFDEHTAVILWDRGSLPIKDSAYSLSTRFKISGFPIMTSLGWSACCCSCC